MPPLSSQEDGATTSALAVRNTGLRKEPSAEDVKFMISLLILGVGTRVQGPQREWNLVVDLELLGPNGRPVFGPQSPWKQLTEATREEIASVPFDATLTLPASLEAGTYVARFTFRDQVSGGRRDHDVSLAFP